MSQYTPQQCREAFYQAAANIEARPELYDFHSVEVGQGDCPTCLWGHVGRMLGMRPDDCVYHAANAVGFDHDDITIRFDVREPDKYLAWHQDACDAAARLRAFADATWPAESTTPQRPDLKECGQSFPALLASLNGEVA